MEVVNWVTKQAGKLADNFNNYRFYVKATPDTLDSSSILSLTTYTSRQEQALVPCEFKWSRIKNGITNEVTEFKGNTFMCEPSDVGCFILAEVTSSDAQHHGTALLKYGPVELDILLKQTISSSLSIGTARFNIQLFHNDVSKQCVFHITDEYMKIQHVNSSASIRFAYNINEPLINVIPKDPTKIIIIFSQKFELQITKFLKELIGNVNLSSQERVTNEMKLTIKFLNRRQKDECLFILKGYNAKKQLKHSIIINKVEKLQINNDNINYIYTIESLERDLQRMHYIYKNHQLQKNIYREESIKLEQEIEEIISSYTKLIQGKFKTKQEFQQSFYDFQNKKDRTVAHKYERIQEQNHRLKEFIKENVDRKFQNVEVNYQNYLNPAPFNQNLNYKQPENPFMKKSKPFDDLNDKKQDNYQKILINLNEQHYIQESPKELYMQNKHLEQKLDNSLHKIERLQSQLEKYEKVNRSAYVDNENNRSMNKHNTSAISISTNKVIDEKLYLEKKYQKLKEQYRKLKTAFHQKQKGTKSQHVGKNKEQSLLLEFNHQNPEFNKEANQEISRLKELITNLQKEKDNLKLKVEFLNLQMKKTKQEFERYKDKNEKKVAELNQQIQLSKRSNDVLNRSQHLNMQMDDYNTRQNQILKQQLSFLQGQNQRISTMCQKYKSQYKRLKEIYKANSP